MQAPSTPERPVRMLLACRGSAADGLGHVIRTRAFAERLPAWVDARLVVLGDGVAAPLLEGLEVEWSIARDDRALISHADALKPDVVVFDTIPLEGSVFHALADRAVTVSLSPIFAHLELVDLAFSRTRYERGGLATAPNRRYGLDYAILRAGCERIDTGFYRRNLDRDRISLAVSMGGADAPNRTLQIVEGLRELQAPATFWVLLGEGYDHSYHQLVDALRRDNRHEVILAKTNQSMWTILQNCSLAILAGGVTTYEAVYAGLPSVNMFESPDHRFLVRELVEAGAAVDGGLLDDDGIPTMRDAVASLEADRDRLLDMHLRSRGMLDDHGVDRVVGDIVSYLHSRARRGELSAV
jgi:spore coat polysaccharide biosynthesis predicted glycosyltransferase SpsG